MPLIQAPAHDFDTLNTVVQRCMHISEKLGQKYTAITVDNGIYPTVFKSGSHLLKAWLKADHVCGHSLLFLII
jgi:hypothetical protein